jgi:hypothetical protein
MSDLSIPLDGIRRAESQINTSAARIARAFTPSSSGGDTVDLSTETVNLLQNRRVAEANISAFHSIDDVQKRLIDILG